MNNLFQQPGLFTFNANVTNNGMASFLLGYVQNFAQASGQFLDLRGHFFGFYAQDSWKAGRRFTFTYGVRYEPFIPWHERQGRMGSFFPDANAAGTHSTLYPLAPAGLKFAGDPGFNPNGIANIYTHFMPRLGFAWDIFGTRKDQPSRRRRQLLRLSHEQRLLQHLLQHLTLHHQRQYQFRRDR